MTPNVPAEPARWTVGRSEGCTEVCSPPDHVKVLTYGHDHLLLAHRIADALNASAVSPEAQAVIDEAINEALHQDNYHALSAAVDAYLASIDTETAT